MEDDSRDQEQVSCLEQLIQPLTLCGGCPAQYLVTKFPRAVQGLAPISPLPSIQPGKQLALES